MTDLIFWLAFVILPCMISCLVGFLYGQSRGFKQGYRYREEIYRELKEEDTELLDKLSQNTDLQINHALRYNQDPRKVGSEWKEYD